MGISDDIINQVEAALNKGIDRNNLKKTAKEVTESVRKRTRLGKSVAKDGENLRGLQPLQSDYKTQRRRLRKKGQLSGKTTPAKSNLTKTGSMLDDLTYKVQNNGFEIKFSKKENEKKAEYVSKDRPFMHLAKFEIKLIIQNIIDRIRRSR